MLFDGKIRYGLHSCRGAEVHFLGDGAVMLRLLDLALQKDKLQIVEKREYTGGLDCLPGLEVDGPIALNITGKGVLIKKTARLESLHEASLRQLFPGYRAEEFYAQHFSSAEQSFVAFIRKEIADRVLAAFRSHGAQVMLFSLGPFVIDHVIPMLNNYGTSLNFDGHQLTLNEEKQWLNYSYIAGSTTGFELKIDIEPIEERFLLAYSAAFQLILNERLELVCVSDAGMKLALTEMIAGIKFRKNSMLILFALLGLLLLNFLLFSYYHQANQELAGKAGRRSGLMVDRQALEKEVAEKEKKVNLLGWNHGLRYSFLCDQIGQTVPAAIQLFALDINAEKEKTQHSVLTDLIETGTMRITGQAANVYVINEWMHRLKQRAWLKTVQLEKYGRDEQQDRQVFTVLLKY